MNADQYALLASTLLPAMAHAGIRLLKVAELTETLRGQVTGAGDRAFCSGADMKERGQGGVIINTSEADTRVMVDDGQTAVIGGLIRTNDGIVRRGVPLLKDIPLIGMLFRSENTIKHFHKELLKYVHKDKLHRGEYKKTENKVHMIDAAGKSAGVLFDLVRFNKPVE